MHTGELSAAEKAAGLTPALIVLGWILITLSLWCFAFWHIPAATPEWLLRAQAACFGMKENGLPDASGWMILVLAPLSFLAAAVVTYGGEIGASLCRALTFPAAKLLAGLLVVSLAAEAIWVTGRLRSADAASRASFLADELGRLPESYPQQHDAAPSFALTDQHGTPVRLEAFRGKPVLLTFAFAHCQTVCPAVMQQVLAAGRQFPASGLEVLIVTLDPWRDTPAALPSMSEKWELRENEHVLSGNPADVLAVQKSYHMEIERNMQTGDVVHPVLSYVIDGDGKIRYVFTNASATWIADGIRRSAQTSSMSAK